MRNKTLLIALVLGLGLTISMLWVLGARVSSVSAAPQAQDALVASAPVVELHVCPSGCTYDNVQEAVDAASEGDMIKVAEGTYTGVSAREGVTQTVYLSKTLTIQGGYTTSDWTTPDPEVHITTLDAQGLGRVLYIAGDDALPTIAGLHITGGNAFNQGSDGAGGGIYASPEKNTPPLNITITDNHIYGNTAYDGGGVYLRNVKYTLSGNTIETNTAERNGGGMYARSTITMTDNLFEGNSASVGGGLLVAGNYALLQSNTFRGNSASDTGGGLGVFMNNTESEGNIFVSNTAQHGGALAIVCDLEWLNNVFVNTLIVGNQASIEGAGIYIHGGLNQLWHTTLAGNSGGDGSGIAIGDYNPWGLDLETAIVDLRDMIVASQDVGLSVLDGSTVAVDSILWFSTPITVSEVPEADVSLVNQILGDPVFADPGNGDYHITGVSAARDVGVVTGTPTDLDGLVRPMGFGYDLGAFEYHDAALSLLKTPSLSGANVGEELTYSIVLTSSGTQDTNGVVLTDTLDAWQRPTAVESPNGNCIIDDPGWGGRVVCSPGNLNIADVITLSLTAEVSTTAPLGQAITNTLSAHANEAANSTQAVVYAQDCHVRIGENPTEYTSVQAAVEVAYPYAVVKVAGACMGVYGPQGWRQQVFLDQPLTLQGGYTPNNWTVPDPEVNITTMDARGLGRVIYILELEWQSQLDIVIDGLQLTGGSSYRQMGAHDPFEENGSKGGGVYVYGADPVFSNDHIIGNTSQSDGGGMFGSFAFLTFHGTTFTANTALGDGGGLAVHAEGSDLIDTRFEANSAENGGGFAAAVLGGGQFTRNTFIGNHANGFGGGLALETAAWLEETLILSNTADERGGGIGFYGSSPFSPYAILTNAVIAGNQADLEGSGIFISSGIEVHMLHTTLARNGGGDGSGVTLGWYDWQSPGASTLLMTDTILAYQDVGIQVSDASTVTVNGVLWFANPDNVWQSDDATVWLWNEHTGDPSFLNPDGGDYHIGENSAARDVGVPSGVTVDIDGERRPMGLAWDLGADEFFDLYLMYLPLTLRN